TIGVPLRKAVLGFGERFLMDRVRASSIECAIWGADMNVVRRVYSCVARRPPMEAAATWVLPAAANQGEAADREQCEGGRFGNLIGAERNRGGVPRFIEAVECGVAGHGPVAGNPAAVGAGAVDAIEIAVGVHIGGVFG